MKIFSIFLGLLATILVAMFSYSISQLIPLNESGLMKEIQISRDRENLLAEQIKTLSYQIDILSQEVLK